MPSKPRNGPLLERISLNPLMISSHAEGLFVSSVEHVVANDNVMAAFDASTTMSSDDDDYWPTDPDDWMHSYRPYVVKDGVLQIPVMGVLLNHFPWQLGRWATGYKYIEMALKRGMDDGNVLAIAFVIDSPGGEVAGCFELCAKIISATADKPIRAFAADSAYSAAYAIAASCGTIIVTQSGGVGSVGVVTAHIEYSDYLQKQGIKVTFIFAGDHKVDGNSYEKLPKSVKDRIQKRIDKIYGVFCGHVSEGRNMDDADVRATNALTYDAEEAIEVGFADRIGSLEEEMVIFTEEVADSAGENYMAQDNVTGKKPGATTPEGGIDQATFDRGVSDAKAEGVAEGSASMLTRIKAIVQSDEGKERPTMATTFALDTSMSAAEAVAVMKNLPKEEAKTTEPPKVEGKTEGTNGAKVEGKNHFAEHMDATGGAGVNGVEDEDGDGTSDSAKATNSILAAFGAETGLSSKKRKAA